MNAYKLAISSKAEKLKITSLTAEFKNALSNEITIDAETHDIYRVPIIMQKEKKDRYVQLSENMLRILRKYYKEFKPKFYLIEGQHGAAKYSGESISKILKSSANRAGIRKRVYPHILRHSFATHHLEQGTDLRHIQVLLGHGSSKTTERYTHVAKSEISKFKNPIDDIFNKST